MEACANSQYMVGFLQLHPRVPVLMYAPWVIVGVLGKRLHIDVSEDHIMQDIDSVNPVELSDAVLELEHGDVVHRHPEHLLSAQDLHLEAARRTQPWGMWWTWIMERAKRTNSQRRNWWFDLGFILRAQFLLLSWNSNTDNDWKLLRQACEAACGLLSDLLKPSCSAAVLWLYYTCLSNTFYLFQRLAWC